jgi:hypothetical protein
MIANLVDLKAYPNGLGGEGYDRKTRLHFSTLDCGSQGIAVRIMRGSGVVWYEKTYCTVNHVAACEVALNNYLRSKK